MLRQSSVEQGCQRTALLVSHRSLERRTVSDKVQTTQVAPTIIRAPARPNAPATGVATSGWSRQQFLSGIFPVSLFPIPAPGTGGDLGRNVFRGPGFGQIDFSLSKEFHVTERIAMRLRGEAFNALNKVNLNNPTLDLSNPNFGKSTSALIPRQFQLGLKLMF